VVSLCVFSAPLARHTGHLVEIHYIQPEFGCAATSWYLGVTGGDFHHNQQQTTGLPDSSRAFHVLILDQTNQSNNADSLIY
jgi:hypothetical protein